MCSGVVISLYTQWLIYVIAGPIVATLTSRATNYNQFQSGRVCTWSHKTHLQIVGIIEDWSYTRKISHKSCDSVIVRSRVTAPLISFAQSGYAFEWSSESFLNKVEMSCLLYWHSVYPFKTFFQLWSDMFKALWIRKLTFRQKKKKKKKNTYQVSRPYLRFWKHVIMNFKENIVKYTQKWRKM